MCIRDRTRVEGSFLHLDGILKDLSGVPFTGYEIHMGKSVLQDGGTPLAEISEEGVHRKDRSGDSAHQDGACRGNVYGCYVHGIFDAPGAAGGFLSALLDVYKRQGLAGVFLGGAICHIPVVIDGFISSAAALCAARIAPEAADYMMPSHRSGEPAGGMVLEALDLSPFIECGMSLGAVSYTHLILMEEKMDVRMVENCGMEEERICCRAEEIPEQAGYYSLLIVKEGKGGEKQ